MDFSKVTKILQTHCVPREFGCVTVAVLSVVTEGLHCNDEFMHSCADGVTNKEKSQEQFTSASSSSLSVAPGGVRENISVSILLRSLLEDESLCCVLPRVGPGL